MSASGSRRWSVRSRSCAGPFDDVAAGVTDRSWRAEVISGDVVAIAILRYARRRMAKRMFESVLEVVVVIIDRQQGGLVRRQVLISYLTVDQFSYAVAHRVVAVLDQASRGLHAQQPG